MAKKITIPTALHSRSIVQIGDTDYAFTGRWNPIAEQWTIAVELTDGSEVLGRNMALVPGTNMIKAIPRFQGYGLYLTPLDEPTINLKRGGFVVWLTE